MRNRKCISHAFIQSSAACLSVIFMLLFFAPRAHAVYTDDSFADIIAVILDSWGISFSTSDSDVDVEYELEVLLDEYLQETDDLQKETWKYMQMGVTELGQLILDFTGAQRVIDFANWLYDKFQLTNNGSFPVYDTSDIALYQIKDAVCFRVPTMSVNGPNSTPFGVYSSSSDAPTYFLLRWANIAETSTSFVVFSKTSNNFTFEFTGSSGTRNQTANLHSGNYTFLWVSTNSFPLPTPLAQYIYPTHINSNSGWELFFSDAGDVTADSPVPPDFNIDTTIINIPTISPGEGLLVTVPGAEWGDSLWEVLDLIERLIGLYDNTQLEIISIVETLENLLPMLRTPISVENIPGGVVLNYDAYDLPLELDWELVNDFFGDVNITKGFTAISDLVYYYRPFRLFVIVIGLTIIAYGFIRMGRDSH